MVICFLSNQTQSHNSLSFIISLSLLKKSIKVEWKEIEEMSELGPQHITIYSVIKEKEILFLYEGSNSQLISSIHFIPLKQKD